MNIKEELDKIGIICFYILALCTFPVWIMPWIVTKWMDNNAD